MANLTLLASIHRSLAACLLRHLVSSLLVYDTPAVRYSSSHQLHVYIILPAACLALKALSSSSSSVSFFFGFLLWIGLVPAVLH
jgi:hypothetical protein